MNDKTTKLFLVWIVFSIPTIFCCFPALYIGKGYEYWIWAILVYHVLILVSILISSHNYPKEGGKGE